jgi:hypothetical protein
MNTPLLFPLLKLRTWQAGRDTDARRCIVLVTGEAMPLRNFGLSLSRRGARADRWHPLPVVSLVVGLILLALLMAWLAR